MGKLRRTEEQSVDYHEEGESLRTYVGYKRTSRPPKITNVAAEAVQRALVDYWEVELQEFARFPEWGKATEVKAATLKRIKAKWGIS
jgi:DNA replicative helicase MCM subunit Mcm2 (Cdc46/Mcm family)